MAYYYAAVKSINATRHPAEAARLRELTVIPYGSFEDLVSLYERGVITNSTALGRFLYMWKVTQLLLIADPYLRLRESITKTR
jgi:hypothetical protein